MGPRRIDRALIAFVAMALLAGCSSPAQSGFGGAAPQIAPMSALPAATTYCPSMPRGSGLLPDGDFSQAAQPGGDVVEYKGDVFAPDWIVTKGDVDFLDSTYWDMAGLCSIDIDGYFATGGIESTGFVTKKGAHYTLSFVLSGNGNCPPTVKQMKVEASGSSTIVDWNTAGGFDVQDGNYSLVNWPFTAQKSTTEIAFISQDPKASSCGAVIAGIEVTKK
jgi:Protein of unknown function (DUF642)